MRLAELNTSTLLIARTGDASDNRFVRARVFDPSNTQVAGSPFTLTNQTNGTYRGTFTPSVEGEYVVEYDAFLDAGFTIRNYSFNSAVEIVNVRPINDDLNTLLTRLTAPRATLLDNLDVAVSTREADSAAATRASNITIAVNTREATSAAATRETNILNSIANLQSDVDFSEGKAT